MTAVVYVAHGLMVLIVVVIALILVFGSRWVRNRQRRLMRERDARLGEYRRERLRRDHAERRAEFVQRLRSKR